MATCKMCGGQLQLTPGQSTVVCEYCGTSVPVAEVEEFREQHEEQARQQWQEAKQNDPQGKALRAELVEKSGQYQALTKGTGKTYMEWLFIPLRILCISLVFFSATMMFAFAMEPDTSGTDPQAVGLVGTLFIIGVFASLTAAGAAFLWLIWRRKNTIHKAMSVWEDIQYLQKELGIWQLVYSFENYQKGDINQQQYLQGYKMRRIAFENTRKDVQNKNGKTALLLQIGIPLVLGFLLALGVSTS